MKPHSYKILVTKPSTKALVRGIKKPRSRYQTNQSRLNLVTQFAKRAGQERLHRTYVLHRSFQWQRKAITGGRPHRLLGSQVPALAIYGASSTAFSASPFAGANSLLALNSIRLLWTYLQSVYGVNHVRFPPLPLTPVNSQSAYQVQRLAPTDFLAFKGLRRTANTVRPDPLLSLYSAYSPTYQLTELVPSHFRTTGGKVRILSHSFLESQLELSSYRDLNSKLRTSWPRTARASQSANFKTRSYLGRTKGLTMPCKPKLSPLKPLHCFFAPAAKPKVENHYSPTSSFRFFYSYLNPRIKRFNFRLPSAVLGRVVANSLKFGRMVNLSQVFFSRGRHPFVSTVRTQKSQDTKSTRLRTPFTDVFAPRSPLLFTRPTRTSLTSFTPLSAALLSPLTSNSFFRSPFFFLSLLTSATSITPGDDSMAQGALIFPKANDIKSSVFNRLRRQKSDFATLISRFNHRNYGSHGNEIIDSSLSGYQTSVYRSHARSPLPFFTSQLTAWSLFKTAQHRQENSSHVSRIKFKPGYNTMWRAARISLRELLEMPIKYQYRLTPRIQQRYFRSRQLGKSVNSLTVAFTLSTSQLAVDNSSTTSLIEQGAVYLNGQVCRNRSACLFTGDFLQLVVSLRYYILLRWMQAMFLTRRSRANKIYYQKYRPSSFNKQISVVRDLPKWFFDLQFSYTDVPKYIEVDYFTLSAFVLNDHFSHGKWLPVRAWNFDEDTLNMYNWKYIT